MKDAQTAIDLLTTRVKNPDEDDWKKLRRLLGYLKRTIKSPMILQADGVNVLKWWMDASYAAHDNMRGHTGGTMKMVKDGCRSIKEFHHTVAQLMFTGIRCRKDAQTAIDLLTTRSEYGEINGSHGKRHDYLGVWID